MTLSELNNLSDEEVDRRAMLTFGWREQNKPAPDWPDVWLYGYDDAPEVAYTAIRFTSDLNAAITLCDKMREEGWSISMETTGKVWTVHFEAGLTDIWIDNESLPRAITLAFLLSKD